MGVSPYAIHWFRRDLRVKENPALSFALQQMRGRVLGVFFLDRTFLARPDFSADRFGFFLQTLHALRREMSARGGELLVLDQSPRLGWEALLGALRTESAAPTWVTWNRDYEPFARARDAEVERFLAHSSIAVRTEADHLIFEPQELRKDDGSPYQVFTPYSRRWLALLSQQSTRLSERLPKNGPDFEMRWTDVLTAAQLQGVWTDRWESFWKQNQNARRHSPVVLPKAGHIEATAALERFQARLADYAEDRDFPALTGTSQLSIYLKNGSLTTAQVMRTLGLGVQVSGSALKFLQELIWREFYYSILFHFPGVETESFQSQYRNLKWENRPDYFAAWCTGSTGYPIVDAGMRQLVQTGWMHNRVRMIVASFLTKDLLVDPRWGERFFMEKLLDGDLAPNNGGWQWAASTGVDAQPYFRIFNPLLQSQRFDPEAKYLARWIPELAQLPAASRHDPTPLERAQAGYPMPIVEHAEQKTKILALFHQARAKN